MVLDSSGSVGRENFEFVKKFAIKLVHVLDVDSGRYRVGIETFRCASVLQYRVKFCTIPKSHIRFQDVPKI